MSSPLLKDVDEAAATSRGRVLLFAPSAYTLGGVATWLDYVVPGLKARGWDVIVALTSGQFHDVACYVQAHPGLPVTVVGNPTGSREGRVLAVANEIRAQQPDIVLSVNVADCVDAVARMRRQHAPCPRLLMTVHGIQPDLCADVELERSTLDGVACSNKLSIALAERAGMPVDRLHYTPYGVSQPSLKTTASDLRAGDAGAPPLRIAYVGRIEQWQKRVFDLYAIADALAAQGVAFEFIVAGSGPDEASLRDKMQAHTAAGRVRWLGHVPAGDIGGSVYARADVLLNPSLWETGPIVAWEAMAHGVVVVSSRYVGSGLEAALVDGENCKLFDIGDTSQAAIAIASLADLRERRRLSLAAHELVTGRYSFEASIESWDRAIHSTLSQPELAPAASKPAAPSGRLDRLLGPAVGEAIRRTLGIRFAHAEPGGEWPHSYGEISLTDATFWQRAAKLDGVCVPAAGCNG